MKTFVTELEMYLFQSPTSESVLLYSCSESIFKNLDKNYAEKFIYDKHCKAEDLKLYSEKITPYCYFWIPEPMI